jgi:hypothetical protein
MSTQTPINVGEICNQLKLLLSRALDQQGEVKSIPPLIDRLVDNVRRIPLEVTIDILRNIFYPFGTRALDHANQVRKC